MTAWDAIQNSIDAGGDYRIDASERNPLSDTELDELEQLADKVETTMLVTRYSGVTPDGDNWAVLIDTGSCR